MFIDKGIDNVAPAALNATAARHRAGAFDRGDLWRTSEDSGAGFADCLGLGQPARLAKGMARASVEQAKISWQRRSDATQKVSRGLETLSGHMAAFREAMGGILKAGGVSRYKATTSDQSVLAKVNSHAASGVHRFFVESLASPSLQVIDLPQHISANGIVSITQNDGKSIAIDLSKVASATAGRLTPDELARAINSEAGASESIRAFIISSGAGEQRLALSSVQSGADKNISAEIAMGADEKLRTAFKNMKAVAEARDAVIRIGGENGLSIRQPSNTFSSIKGVSITFERPSNPGEVFTVEARHDPSAAAEGVQTFIDAYNGLRRAASDLSAFDARGSSVSNALAMRGLLDKLDQLLRENVSPGAGMTLHGLGVRSDKRGLLSIDRPALESLLNANPRSADQLLTGGPPSTRSEGDGSSTGVIGGLIQFIERWLDPRSGELARRRDLVSAEQQRLDENKERLEARYERIHSRYSKQFHALHSMQAEMARVLKQLDEMFSVKQS